jgi:hypothetical protein
MIIALDALSHMLDHSVVKAFPSEDINRNVLAIGAPHVRGFEQIVKP